ncbi:MAG: aldehyde dehydrogenase family protein, partial [Microcoleaceae cyanobacterium]
MAIATINPASGETLKTFEPLSDRELLTKIELADRAWQDYRFTTFAQRAQWMQNAANVLEQNKEHYGTIMTQEMGKTLKSAIAEAEKCASVCRYYAENAAQFLADVSIPTDTPHSFVRYQPLGAILAVMPWNFPFWQVFRFAAPALMAGNVGLLKHASNVPQCALLIEEIFRDAGFPEGVFQTLLVGANKVAQIIADPRVKAAALTGSEPAGESLASHAGKQLKKTVLELGGSDPFIVMPSADLDAAVAAGVTGRLLNNGQSCIAAKRFILHKDIADNFITRFVDKFQALKIGDPMLPDTDIGPLAT